MSKTPNQVFVLDSSKKPLTPCLPVIARKLLNAGKAHVFRQYPFAIILNKSVVDILTGNHNHDGSQTSLFGFLRPSNCLCSRKRFGLMFTPQTLHGVSHRLMYRNLKRNSMYVVDSRDVHHCPILWSQSANFSAPLQALQTLVLGLMSALSGWVCYLFYFTKSLGGA